MNARKLIDAIKLGFKSLLLHKLRSGLTVLGIIFGVCSVISMLAVGEGASQQAQEQIKQLGSNNIILETFKPGETDEEQNSSNKYGINEVDLQRILSTVQGVETIVPVRKINAKIKFEGQQSTAEVKGTTLHYLKTQALNIVEGRNLSDLDNIQRNNSCVLSQGLAKQLFPLKSPLEQTVTINGHCFEVVGISAQTGEQLNNSADKQALIPLNTLRMRFGKITVKRSSGNFSAEEVELHQAILKMKNAAAVLKGEGQIRQILKYGHKKINDYKMTVPLQLLQQAKQTQKMFNLVLGSIAAISLLVGGIGIMNIMLATVTERSREIGIRRALGAKKKDVIAQFMIESVLLSVSGGLAGIALGVTMPHLITQFTEMDAVVTWSSILLSFGISALIGIIFGIYPAAKSAQLDPIEALRSE